MATETKTKTKGKEDMQLRVRIRVKAYDHKVLEQSLKTIMETISQTGAKIVGPVPLPTVKKKFTVQRATFVKKTSRDQYEMRIHKRFLDIINPGPKTIEALSNLELPAGISVEIKM